jgi:hypothetical protein
VLESGARAEAVRDGGDGDDARAAARAGEERKEELDEEKVSEVIDGHLGLEALRRGGARRHGHDAGVEHEHVDDVGAGAHGPRKQPHRRQIIQIDHAGDDLTRRHIGRGRQLGDQRLRLRHGTARHVHARARLEQSERGLFANAARGAGHNRHLATRIDAARHLARRAARPEAVGATMQRRRIGNKVASNNTGNQTTSNNRNNCRSSAHQ